MPDKIILVPVLVAAAILLWESNGQTLFSRLWGLGKQAWQGRAQPQELNAVAEIITPSADDLLISAGRLLVENGRHEDARDVFAIVTRQPKPPLQLHDPPEAA